MTSEALTPFEFLSLLITVAGVAVVVLTLRYLVKQTRHLSEQTKHLAESIAISSLQTVSTLTIEVDRIFVDYPETRPYFYSGTPISEDKPNYHRVLAIAECLLDLFDTYISTFTEVLRGATR